MVAVKALESALDVRQAGRTQSVAPGTVRRHKDGHDFLVVRLRFFAPFLFVHGAAIHPAQRKSQRRAMSTLNSAPDRAVNTSRFLQNTLFRLFGQIVGRHPIEEGRSFVFSLNSIPQLIAN